MATTPNYGWTLPTVGGDPDTWGTVLNALLDAVDAQVKANQNQAGYAAPTGVVTMYNGSTAPTGWIIQKGGTIGNSSSNGTNRGADDCEALFTLYWTNYTSAAIYDSAGNVSSRGASAAADWAANKAITVLDTRGRFIRGLALGAALDNGRVLGSAQSDAMQNVTGSLGYLMPGSSNGTNWYATGPFATDGSTGSAYSGAGASVKGATFDLSRSARTSTETRPSNIALCLIEKL